MDGWSFLCFLRPASALSSKCIKRVCTVYVARCVLQLLMKKSGRVVGAPRAAMKEGEGEGEGGTLDVDWQPVVSSLRCVK